MPKPVISRRHRLFQRMAQLLQNFIGIVLLTIIAKYKYCSYRNGNVKKGRGNTGKNQTKILEKYQGKPKDKTARPGPDKPVTPGRGICS